MRLRAVPLLVAVALSLAGAALAVRAQARPASTGVLDVGDSLSVGTAPYLRERLGSYRIESIHDLGLHAYDAARIVAADSGSLPPVVVVSAGTNDDPRIVSTFIRAVHGVVSYAGEGRCVVWPTIVRPPAVGASYARLNAALRRAAARHPNLVLVDWVGMVRRHLTWLAADGVHVSASGYKARADAIAAAVRTRCRT